MVSFSAVVLFWYLFPIIVLFACNYIISSLSLAERYKVKAPDIAIPFLFLGLHELSKQIYAQSILLYLLLSVFLLGIGVAVFQAYYYREIIYSRYFKMFWRLVFLLSMVIYIAVALINLIQALF